MYLTPKFEGVLSYGSLTGSPGAAVQALTSSITLLEFAPNDGMALEQVSFLCTTSVSSTSAPVIVFWKRLVAGSVSGATDVQLGTLTIPTGTVSGNLVYEKVSETATQILQGQSLVFTVTGVASSAGKGIVSFQAGQLPNTGLNLTAASITGVAVTG